MSEDENGLVDKTFGFYSKAAFKGDLNNFVNGYAECEVGCVNTPSSNFYGFIEAYRTHNVIVQHAYDANAHKVYERIYFSAWRPWVQLN